MCFFPAVVIQSQKREYTKNNAYTLYAQGKQKHFHALNCAPVAFRRPRITPPLYSKMALFAPTDITSLSTMWRGYICTPNERIIHNNAHLTEWFSVRLYCSVWVCLRVYVYTCEYVCAQANGGRGSLCGPAVFHQTPRFTIVGATLSLSFSLYNSGFMRCRRPSRHVL